MRKDDLCGIATLGALNGWGWHKEEVELNVNCGGWTVAAQTDWRPIDVNMQQINTMTICIVEFFTISATKLLLFFEITKKNLIFFLFEHELHECVVVRGE